MAQLASITDVQELSRQSVLRHNAVMSSKSTPEVSELWSLHAKLAKALAESKPLNAPPGLEHRSEYVFDAIPSVSSTVDSDNASDCASFRSFSDASSIFDDDENFLEEDPLSSSEVTDESDDVPLPPGLDHYTGGMKIAPPPGLSLSAVIAKVAPPPGLERCKTSKKQNMEELFNSSKDEPPTTIMIRNIPSRYSQHKLMEDLKDLSFDGTYDFLYVPMDRRTGANVGYAFVNFISPSSAERCMQSFNNYCFPRVSKAHKPASTSVAHLQGLERNLQHYEKGVVATDKRQRRPVVVAKIAKMLA